MDTTGVIKWANCYGGTESDYGYGAAELPDSGIVVVGASYSNDDDVEGHHDGIMENTDIWVIKLKETCNQVQYFSDADGDLFGALDEYIYSCIDTIGYVLNNLDCNDTDPLINPGIATDVCNNIDDNCNGTIDEDAIFLIWFEDADADGFGDLFSDSVSCDELSGFVFDATDCDDLVFGINPGADEICNMLDENCNNLIDEDLIYSTYYIDADGDDFGNFAIDSVACLSPFGFVDNNNDCDDTNPDIFPGATELLNGLDDNCDQIADEGLGFDAIEHVFDIYPNPTQGFILVSNTIGLKATLTIANTIGQTIYTSSEINTSIELDISDYSSGLYLLTVFTQLENYSFEIIKE